MALVLGRTAFIRFGGMNCWLGKKIHPLVVSKMAPAAPIQVAGLKATYGGKFEYPEPWHNWEKRRYNWFHEWLDNTSKRLNENSKVIIVEGSVAVGKNAFAKRLASAFDLKYIESIQDDKLFLQDGFDMRQLNALLPATAHFYDMEKFLTDPTPEYGRVGRLQLQWLFEKFLVYAHGLHHLLSTGQGFVMVRSPWSDDVYADTLRRMGYITRDLHKFYYEFRDSAVCELLKPHITVYLDAPVETLKQRIKARDNPAEVNSKVLNDKYLQTLETVFKDKFLARMGSSGHVVDVDWNEVADDMEMDVIIEEIERLDLESQPNDHSRFEDWHNHSEDMYCYFRKYFGSYHAMVQCFSVPYPMQCTEIGYRDEDLDIVKKVLMEHPLRTDLLNESASLGRRSLFSF